MMTSVCHIDPARPGPRPAPGITWKSPKWLPKAGNGAKQSTRRRKIVLRMAFSSQRLHVLDQIGLFLIGQAECEVLVVVIDDVEHRGETAVVIEAAFLACKETAQRCRA